MFTQFLKSGSAFTNDTIVLVTLFVVFFLATLYFGRSRTVSFILSFYPTAFLFGSFPFLEKFVVMHGDKMIAINKLVIFLIFFAPINIMISRHIFSDFSEGPKHYFRIIGYSFALLVVVMIFTYSIINLDSIYNFTSSIDSLFSGPVKIFWWSLVPAGILLIL